MSAFVWWRSWHGAPMDSKWPVIATRAGVKVGQVSAVVWALFDYASQHKTRGTVTGFDAEIYAVYSGFPESEVLAIIQALTDKGVIVDGRLAKWDERQPKREDDSAGRVRDWREKKRNVTQCNAETEDETIYSVSVSLSDSSLSDSSLSDSWVKEERPNIFTVYENEIGPLTPMIGEELEQAEKDYPPGWPEDAIKEASKNNKRSWAYARAILKRWNVEGRKTGNSNGGKKHVYAEEYS